MILFTMYWLWLRARTLHCCKLRTSLEGVLRALRGGKYLSDVLGNIEQEGVGSFLRAIFWNASHTGHSIIPALELACEQSRLQELFGLKQRRLYQLLILRFGVVFLVVVAARYYLLSHSPIPNQDWQTTDFVGLGLGVLLAGICLWQLDHGILKLNWFWQRGGLTAGAKQWLGAVFSMSTYQLADLMLEAKAKSLVQEQRLSSLEDFLPLCEILGIGLPSVLALSAPMLALIN